MLLEALTLGTEMGPTVADDPTDDGGPATDTREATPLKDTMPGLEPAFAPVRVQIGIDAGATMPDPLTQHFLNGTMESAAFRRGEGCDRPFGVELGAKEGLIGINIPQAREHTLVEERGLDDPPPPRETPFEGSERQV